MAQAGRADCTACEVNVTANAAPVVVTASHDLISPVFHFVMSGSLLMSARFVASSIFV